MLTWPLKSGTPSVLEGGACCWAPVRRTEDTGVLAFDLFGERFCELFEPFFRDFLCGAEFLGVD